MDTHDKYCTVNALKKEIIKSLLAHSVQSTSSELHSTPLTIQTLLPGLLRMNKNPQSPFVFMAFATPEDRLNALNLLSTVQHRKKMKWTEAEISSHDLALTHKGGQHKRMREEHQTNTQMCVQDDDDEKTSELVREATETITSKSTDEVNNKKNNSSRSKLVDYAHLTLEEQHKLKYRHCWNILKSLVSYSEWQLQERELTKENNGKKNKSVRASLAHRVNELFYEGVLSSPINVGYRNHVNLSFGYDDHGKPALGFNKGAVLDGTAAIESVTWDIPSLLETDNEIESEEKHYLMKDALCTYSLENDITSLTTHHMARLIATAIMQVCNKFTPHTIQNCKSKDYCSLKEPQDEKSHVILPVYDKLRDFGFWRKVQIRHSVQYEAMVTITVNEGEYEWTHNNNNNNINEISIDNIKKEHESNAEIECKETNANECKHEVQKVLENVKTLIVQVLTSQSFTHFLQEVCECITAKVVSIHYCTLSPLSNQQQQNNNNNSAMKETLQHEEEEKSNEKNVEENTQITQIHENGKNYEHRDIILFGSATLIEHLCNYRFELSPASFFQVNTPGMERLLNALIHRADLQVGHSTLLDLCCGTGTIGLVLSQYVKRVVGIELVPEAITNARSNCELNHITNATFYVGRVEHVLPSVIQSLLSESSSVNLACKKEEEKDSQYEQEQVQNEQNCTIMSNSTHNNKVIGTPHKDEFIAILDPPRAGVNSTVIKWIRGTTAINKVIYISCDQNALLRDCPLLTKPPSKAYRGKPFQYTAAFAVDLFPHTRHVEMIVVLSRERDSNTLK